MGFSSASAAEMGLSKTEYEDAVNLEKLYFLANSHDQCALCGRGVICCCWCCSFAAAVAASALVLMLLLCFDRCLTSLRWLALRLSALSL